MSATDHRSYSTYTNHIGAGAGRAWVPRGSGLEPVERSAVPS